MSARLIQNVLALIVIVSVFLSAASPVIARPADVRAPVSRAMNAPLPAMQQPSPLDALWHPNKTMPPNVSVPPAAPASNPVPLPRHCDGVTPPGSDLPCCMYGYIYFNGQPVANAQVHIQSAYGYKDTFSAPGQAGGQPYFSFDLSSPPFSATVGSMVTVTASYSGMVSSRTWVVQPNGQQVDLGLLAGVSDRSTPAAMPQPDRPALARPSAVQATSVLSYATFLGGSSDEIMHATYVDGAGNFYVTGYAYSANFPTTPGAYDTSFNGNIDAFVAKFNASGALIYSTFLGGSGEDVGWGIYADEAGQIYVAGYTDSAVFPTTVGAYDTSPNGGRDVFVLKLNAAGTDLIYSTVIGGSGWDWPNGLVVNASGEVYFAGVSSGSGYPTTPGAYQSTAHGGWDAVVTRLNASGSDVIYSTFIGGGCDDYGSDPVLDASGAIYLKGWTCSSDFPITPGAYDTTFGGGGYGNGGDGFVTKLNATGTTLIYSTYIGGSGMDDVTGFAVDLSGAAYAIGMTKSADFPTTAGAWDTVRAGESDAFVLKLTAAGNGVVYSTLVGGSLAETGWDGRVDASGQVTLVGNTNSSDFPVTAGAFDAAHNGGTCNNAPCFDFFATTLNAAGSNLIYSTYLGGSGDEGMPGVQRGSDGTVYLAGDTLSADYPVTAGAYDGTLNGGRDVVVTAWRPGITSPCSNCSIAGRVTVAAAGLSGVSMAGSNGSIVTTDGNGYYTFTTALTGTYTVTPTKLGYFFTPASRTNSVPPAATGQDFAGTALPAEGEWVQVYPASTPPMRVYFAMAYDSDRQRTIIFGGQKQGQVCSQETWEYDGVNWAQVATTGPAARESARMVYDPINHRVILFGGYPGCGSSTPSNDTWSYNPATHVWTQLAPATSPGVRGDFQLAYDGGRQTIVLFGGWNGSYLGDTWEFNGTTWVPKSPAHSPVGRAAAALTYLPSLGKVVLYGGYCDGQCADSGPGFRDELWAYDGTDWTLISNPTGTGSRAAAAVDVDTARGRLVVFGGWEGPWLSDHLISETWEYNGVNWWQIATPLAPTARFTSMVYDAARGRFVLYGGYDGSNYLNDTWEYIPAALNPAPVVDFQGLPLSGSAPLQVQFSEQVQGRVTAWTWHFGDGGLSGARYPTYLYNDAGLYDVSLTVAGPDGLSAKTRTAYVRVYLTARFDAAPKSGTAPLTVAFVNQSTGNITSWLWNFGDGSFSSTPNPTHIYSVPGVYTVTLSVSSPGGSAGVSKPNLITVAAPPTAPRAWTVMLYMAGDNNANDPMLEALAELEQIPDNLNANVVVLHDGYYNNDTRLYHITSHPESGINSLPVAVGWNPGEMNMGDPQTLIEFVNWARAEYPAQHYLLSILDHGRGTTGLAQDDTNGHDLLTAYTELRAALNTVTANGANKIDVVYFDTCLMGMIEDAYQLRGLADYMVASENLGWSFFPYQQHVQTITAATSPRQLAQTLADTYFGSGPLPRTVAAIDLAAVAQTGAAIGNLGQALHTYLQNGGNPWAIYNARENVQVFDSRDYGVLTPSDEYVDIYHLAQRLATEVIPDTAVQTAAQAVLTATQQAVVVEHHQSGWALGNYWNLDNAHGLSIYFPRQSGGWDYYNYVNPQVVTTTWQFTSQTLWDEFLKWYFMTGITPPDPAYGFDGLGEVQIPHYGIYLPLVRR